MNRIKDVIEEQGVKQVWSTERLGKSFNTVVVVAKPYTTQLRNIV